MKINSLMQKKFTFAKQIQSPKGFFLNRGQSPKGFTLIEILVYVTLLSIISLVIVIFINQLLGVNETTRRTRESLDNARRSLETISQEIRHANSIYTPTSVLGTNPGQLSLATVRDLPTDENITYVDFYVDNNNLYLKREGQSASLLTSEKVKVTNLTFVNNNTGGSDAIRISITVEYKDPINGPKNEVTLTSTAALRSY